MIKEVRFSHWKSFEQATLYIDPITVLIGTNASGKSNALDGIAFLNRIAQGVDLQASLAGEPAWLLDGHVNSIRGGVEWAAMKPGTRFTIEAVVEESEVVDYSYAIQVQTFPQVELVSESLIKIEKTPKNKETKLFIVNENDESSPTVTGYLYNGKGAPKKRQFKTTVSVLSQLRNQELREEISLGVECVAKALENIFILDPIPSLMRDFKPFSAHLARNASNLAGVLAALPPGEKKKTENLLSNYLSRLPEGDIRRVWAEPVGRFKKDAMLYCEERWTETGEKLEVDARGLSDGTLRFLGILTALLTRPEKTLIVIEEVDNGLHPSRARVLLEMLKEIGQKRHIDILVTTHNPALLDQLGPEMVPFIIVAHRSRQTGKSELTLLEDLSNLPKLLASGPIGQLVARGDIESSLRVGGASNET